MLTGVLILAAAGAIAAAVVYHKKAGPQNSFFTGSSYALGTIVQLKAYGNHGPAAIDEAIIALNDVDDIMSAFKCGSDVSRINNNAGKSPQAVNPSTYFLLKRAIEYCKLTEGAFDPTIRPLVRLWNKGIADEQVPDETALSEKLPLVNYNDIIFNDDNGTVMLKNKGQEIDLGGIAKGFAADEVRDIFIKHNIKHALIDLGGNILTMGGKIDGTSWNVGIQNPFKHRGQYLGILMVRDKSVVTSGNYEKYFMKDGRVFHHIIDPRTGHPSESKIVSATIISKNSIDGDGLSTGIYIMGVEKAIRTIESLKGIDAILVTGDKKIFMTRGIEKHFQLTDDNFSIDRSCDVIEQD